MLEAVKFFLNLTSWFVMWVKNISKLANCILKLSKVTFLKIEFPYSWAYTLGILCLETQYYLQLVHFDKGSLCFYFAYGRNIVYFVVANPGKTTIFFLSEVSLYLMMLWFVVETLRQSSVVSEVFFLLLLLLFFLVLRSALLGFCSSEVMHAFNCSNQEVLHRFSRTPEAAMDVLEYFWNDISVSHFSGLEVSKSASYSSVIYYTC